MKNNIGKTHYEQLLSYAESAAQEGWYYGNKIQFQKRHGHIIKFLEEAILRCESKKGKQNE